MLVALGCVSTMPGFKVAQKTLRGPCQEKNYVLIPEQTRGGGGLIWKGDTEAAALGNGRGSHGVGECSNNYFLLSSSSSSPRMCSVNRGESGCFHLSAIWV